MRTFWLAVGFHLCFVSLAQKQVLIAQDSKYQSNSIAITEDSTQISIDGQLTALRIYWKETAFPLKLVVNQIEYGFSGHRDQDLLHPQDFVILDKACSNFSIYSSGRGQLIIESFNADHIDPFTSDKRKKKVNCEQPARIGPDQWRNGLSDPNSGRIEVEVKHCIVHHAASSNAQTDYTAVVRNIYLLHTESNGWDDIGYNYLIAPNGQVYLGRDPLGVADEDNIQGAHFCSKNSGTMGVCLIGNYTEIAPSDTMLLSLKELLTWKLHKENISALASFPHPNANSEDLASIAMHSEGCSTQCPGDSIAFRIAGIKIEVESMIKACQGVGIPHFSASKPVLYPNPTRGSITIRNAERYESMEIIDYLGRTLLKIERPNPMQDLSKISKGLYTIVLLTHGGNKTNLSLIIQ